MDPPRDPRLIIQAILEAWAPIGASVEHHTSRVALEAEHVDWVAFNHALDAAETYLRETQKPSGEMAQVKP